MDTVWIVKKNYRNADREDGSDVYGDSDWFIHRTYEGARKRFEELKEELELWGMSESDYEEYKVTEDLVILEYCWRRNELYIKEEKVYD